MAKRTVVNVEFPESTTTNPKAILLTADDTTESVIEKINTKLRVENGSGLVSIKPNDGEEIPCNPGDIPYDIWAQYGANNAVIWFRPRELEGAQVTAWDDFDDFGFGSMRMMEGNETADQFDELLSQLKFEELQPTEGEFNPYAQEEIDTENLPICSSCGGPIIGKVLMAFNMPWHPEHLGCAVCQNPFTGGRKVMEGEDGNAYCEQDFIDTFAVKCGKCGDPVIGECVNALGIGYHPEHFCCAMCNESLIGAFFEHEGDIYCEKHYYQKINLLCPECEKPIYKKCVNANGVRYHVDHFKCTFCKKNLAGLAFFMHKGKQYCKEDSLKLFG